MVSASGPARDTVTLLSSWVLAAQQTPPNFERSERGRVEQDWRFPISADMEGRFYRPRGSKFWSVAAR